MNSTRTTVFDEIHILIKIVISCVSYQLNRIWRDLSSLITLLFQCHIKLFLFFFSSHLYLVLLLISSIFAAPGVTPTNKPTCTQDCSLEYAPICAGPKGTTNDREKKSFGNDCVMKKYNCEKGESSLIFIIFIYSMKSIPNKFYSFLFLHRFGDTERRRMSRWQISTLAINIKFQIHNYFFFDQKCFVLFN